MNCKFFTFFLVLLTCFGCAKHPSQETEGPRTNVYNPLAELTQCIFDSSNGFVVNVVDIL